MKICKDCKKRKKQQDFYGVQGECKKCTRQRVKKNYKKNIEHYIDYEKKRFKDPKRKKKLLEYQRNRREKFKGKSKARNIINSLVRNGKLKQQSCEVCKSKKSEAHHPDYRKPLLIQWLCRKHHLEKHKKNSYD